MNTRKKQDRQKNQRQKVFLMPKQETKKELQSWDMWEMLHAGLKNREHERPETQLIR